MRHVTALALAFGLAIAAVVPMASAQPINHRDANRVHALMWVERDGIYQIQAPTHDK